MHTAESICCGVLSAVLLAGAGCARDKAVVRRESTYVSDDDGFGPDRTVERRTTTTVADADADGRVEERSTTRVDVDEEYDEDEPRGVLSTTVHFIGEIIALPFRLIGGLLRAIF